MSDKASRKVEVIPEELVEVQDAQGRPLNSGAKRNPRFQVRERGCFFQTFNCGCGCLLLMLLPVALILLLRALWIQPGN